MADAAGGFGDMDAEDGGAGKEKHPLVVLASAEDRARALRKGYLSKLNSKNKWQKRWFEIVGHFFVYYKNEESRDMLCAMDLHRATDAEIDKRAPSEFLLTYDRERSFRSSSPEDAAAWVQVIRAVQRTRPVGTVVASVRDGSRPASAASGSASPSKPESGASGASPGIEKSSGGDSGCPCTIM